MNRVLTFFLASFFVHIVMGALLLSKTGFFKGQKEGESLETSTPTAEQELLDSAESTSPNNQDLMPVSKSKASPAKSTKPLKKALINPDKKTTKPQAKKIPSPPTLLINDSTATKSPTKQSTLNASKKGAGNEPSPSAPVGKNLDKNKPPSATLPVPAKSTLPVATKPLPKSPVAQGEDNTLNATSPITPKAPSLIDEEDLIVEEKPKQKPVLLDDEDEEEEPLKTSAPAPTPKPQPATLKSPPAPTGSASSAVTKKALSNNSVPLQQGLLARSHTQLKQMAGNPIPSYPKEALKKKWEGRIEVFYYVNPAGFVEKIQLKKSSGHSVLDNAALRALSRYRYQPGQEGWVRHPVEFFLEKGKEVKETVPLGKQQ